jgi:hypothetical protein
MLCVGGPKDGQRALVKSGATSFKVVVPPRPLTTTNFEVGDVSYEYVEYIERRFFTDDPSDYVAMWVPSTDTVRDTMTLLLNSYARRK